jgi:hypothetical protein
VWLQRNGAWILFSTRYYSGGALRAFYGPQVVGTPSSVCLYEDGKLRAESMGACPSFEEASRPAPSLAPGCVTTDERRTTECSKYE